MGKRKPGNADTEGGGGKRKRAGYFSANTKASIPKCRGFLVSCWGGKEQQAAREAIELLTEYYEKLSPAKAQVPEVAPSTDIAASLASEVAELKQQEGRLFNYHSTGVSGLAYITMRADAEGPGPVEIVTALAEDVQKARQCKCRMCIRFIPIEVVCHADLEDIKKTAKDLVEQHFPADAASPCIPFAVFYEHRASVKLDRMEVINSIVDQIPQPPHKVNLTSPEKTVIVQLLKSSAALSVAPKHKELMRFNLKELSTTDAEQVKAAHEAKKKDSVGAEATETVKTAAGNPETANGQAGAEDAEQQRSEGEPSKEGTHPESDKVVQDTKDTAVEKVPAVEEA